MNRADETFNTPTTGFSRRSSLRYRLIFLLSIILVVVLLVNGISLFLLISRSEQNLWQGRQADAVQFSADTVAEFIQRAQTALTLAGLPDQATVINNPQFQLLSDLLAENPFLLELVRLNGDGRVMASANQPQESPLLASLITIPQSVWFREALAGQTFLGDVQVSEGKPYVIMAVPTPYGGVVAARLKMDNLWDLVAGLDFGETGQTYVINQKGRVVAHTDPQVALTKTSLEGRTELKSLLEVPNSAWRGNYINFEGQAVAGTSRAVPGTQWIVMTELLQSEVTAVSRTALTVLAVITLFIGLVAVAVTAWFLRGLIFQPLTQLQTGAERIGHGDLQYRIELSRRDEIGQVAGTFNQMVTQLQDLYISLQERGHRLERVTGLNERLNAILNLEALLAAAVNQIKEEFDYYHVHIYLLDEMGQTLLVAEGAGQAGQELKAKGHSIALNAPRSLVARAARNGEVVKIDNAREAEDWLPNPLLPDTYAEMAVPILLEGQVVGVLDVQEDEIGGLDDNDASLLRLVANQIAVGIRNAQQFAEVETSLAEARVLQEKYLRQAWQRKVTVRPDYTVQHAGAAALPELVQEQLKQAALQNNHPTVLTGATPQDAEAVPVDYSALVAPIKLQNQVIGAMHFQELDPNRQWSAQELALVQAVAEQVALTAENLRLFEETREQAGREQTIREITDKLRAAPNIDYLLETAARELGSRIGVRHTVLELGIEQHQDQSENGNHKS